ncbi:hypothetical protein INR49_017302 [Caranx melampygus]|nr:hypothetical protein INR49_017302 [Caranx melampygus]
MGRDCSGQNSTIPRGQSEAERPLQVGDGHVLAHGGQPQYMNVLVSVHVVRHVTCQFPEEPHLGPQLQIHLGKKNTPEWPDENPSSQGRSPAGLSMWRPGGSDTLEDPLTGRNRHVV